MGMDRTMAVETTWRAWDLELRLLWIALMEGIGKAEYDTIYQSTSSNEINI